MNWFIQSFVAVVSVLTLSVTSAHAVVLTNIPGPYTAAGGANIIIVTNTDPWVGTNYLNSAPSKTLYYRFSMEWNTIRTYGALELYTNANEVFGIGDNSGSANWSCFYYASGNENDFDLNPATTIVANQWHTFVVKISFNQGAVDNETIWMDPNFANSENNQSSAIITTQTFDASFNRVYLRAGDSATYSNIVFATTAGSVGFTVSATPVIDTLVPPAGATQVIPSTSIGAHVTPGAGNVNINGVTLAIDGVPASPSFSVDGNGVITLSYQPPAPFAANTTHTNTVIATDVNGVSATNTWSFTVGQATLPATFNGPFSVSNGVDIVLLTANNSPWIGTNYMDNAPATTLYYRFNMEMNALAGLTTTFAGLELYNGNTEVLLLGKGDPQINWSGDAILGPRYFNFQPVTPIVTGQWHTVVAKVTFNPGAADTLTVWLDPNFSQPETNQVSWTNVTTDCSFNNVHLRCGNSPASATFSNIIFAATAGGVGFGGQPPSYADTVQMLTYHNDNLRSGVNTNETILTLASVVTNKFGKLFSQTVDGYVYAQPLVVTNVNIPGRGPNNHNVVYVVTEHDSVYAFDADNNSGANATPLWQTSFLVNGETTVPNGDVGSTDISPEIGTTSTPVIDPVTGTIYVCAKTKTGSGTYIHRLHALDITTGLERTNFNSPVVIAATNYPGVGAGGSDTDGSGHVLWNPLRQLNRPAVALQNGVIYLAFGSHGDQTPYHGWLFAYNATNVAQQLSVYNSTPNGAQGAFWQSGGGPVFDATGNLYLMTGNGDFNATGATFNALTNNFAMSMMKFSTTNGIIKLLDYFTPNDQSTLSGEDSDLASGAPLALPDSAGSVAHPRLMVGAGKKGDIYLVNRDNMGHFQSGSDSQIVQSFTGGISGGGQSGSFDTPAYFNNYLYYWASNDRLKAFALSNGVINTTPTQGSTQSGQYGSTPCITANGTSNAIVWAFQTDAYGSSGPGILRAYNATNITQELYDSSQLSQDSGPPAVKFATPTIVNGKIYVGGQYAMAVYGLGSFLPVPTIAPNGGIFTNSVAVTLADSASGAAIYYTLDGTAPTTNSILYTVPFVVKNSLTVNAIATGSGYVNSTEVSATFINSSAIGNGTGLLGAYYGNHNSVNPYTGAPTMVRTDAVINFNWTSGPGGGIAQTNFTARWTGCVQPQFNETYTFYATADDGVRLWVNGQELVNGWVDEASTTYQGSIALKAQQLYNIEMDYYQVSGGAIAELQWGSPSTTEALVPQTQLYPYTNPPPTVVLTSPAGGATYTASASVTIGAMAAAPYNPISSVSFYTNNTLLGVVSNSPTAPLYTLTTTGLGAGSYVLTAVAVDGSGLSSTSAPVNITVNASSGQAYGLTNCSTASAFFNMPPAMPHNLPGALPLLLSQTGVFSNTPSMTPTNGLIPYSPNVPLWSDAAVKTRWLSVPNNGGTITPDEQITFGPTGTWTFPSGTVFVKHFSLVTNQITGGQRRLETRLLVRDINGAVYGVTYKWRGDSSEADLLTNSLDEAITITNSGTNWTQTWHYPSPAECLQCHTAVANYVLGLSTRQLNGNFTYPSTGVTDNQVRTLNRLGLLNPGINETAITNYEKLSNLTNLTASLQERARSYLDANCVQCHQPGGTGPTFDARYETPLASQSITNVPAVKGNLGVDNAMIVMPRDIWRSMLYARMNTTNDTYKMPNLARNLIDTNAVQVMGDWINSLPGTPALAPPTITPNGGTYVNSVNVSLQSTNYNATLYYTLDGTLPTTNSLFYTGPFNLTNGATVSVNAFAPNYNNSVAASAQFSIQPLLITSATFNAGPGFQMSLIGMTGSNYVLQASTNLVNWTPISTNLATTNIFNLYDPAATGFLKRFYRVIQQ
jgi:uncharacterized repeat protein (TIGR03806 family)